MNFEVAMQRLLLQLKNILPLNTKFQRKGDGLLWKPLDNDLVFET